MSRWKRDPAHCSCRISPQTEWRIAAIDQRLAKAEGALEAVAGQWDTLATSQRDIRDEIGRVHARVDEVARTSSEVAGQLRQIARGMDLLTKHNLAEHGS